MSQDRGMINNNPSLIHVSYSCLCQWSACKNRSFLFLNLMTIYIVVLERGSSNVASSCILQDYGIPKENIFQLIWAICLFTRRHHLYEKVIEDLYSKFVKSLLIHNTKESFWSFFIITINYRIKILFFSPFFMHVSSLRFQYKPTNISNSGLKSKHNMKKRKKVLYKDRKAEEFLKLNQEL